MLLVFITGTIVIAIASYAFGLYHQSQSEVLPDALRLANVDVLAEMRWKARDGDLDMDFLRRVRAIDPRRTTVHNLTLDQVLRPTGTSTPAKIHATRVTIDAVKIDPDTGAISLAILRPENPHAESIKPILSRAGILTTISHPENKHIA